MRKVIVTLLATAASFFVAGSLLSGVHLTPTWDSYLVASLVFVVFSAVMKPVIKLLLLPINLLTLGLFRWVSGVLVLYLFDLVYDALSITAFTYPGLNSSLISLPPTYLPLFWVLVLTSLVMSLTYAIINSLFLGDN